MRIPARARAPHRGLARSGDLTGQPHGGDDGVDVGVHAPVGVPSSGVAPRDGEHLVTGCREVLHDAPVGRQVQGVVLIDRGWDEQERSLVHLRRAGRELEELEHRRPVHDVPGRDGQVAADLEGRGVDHARHPRRTRHVADQRADPPDPRGAPGVDRLLQGRGRERRVRRGERIDHVVDHEGEPLEVLDGELAVPQCLVRFLRHDGVDLQETSVERLLSHAGSTKRRSCFGGETSDTPATTRVSSRPSSTARDAGRQGRRPNPRRNRAAGPAGSPPPDPTYRGPHQGGVERHDVVVPHLLGRELRHPDGCAHATSYGQSLGAEVILLVLERGPRGHFAQRPRSRLD